MYSIPFLTAKIVDIGIVTVYYVLAAIVISLFVNYILGPYDEKKHDEMNIGWIVLEIIIQFFIMGILAYSMRNIVERIPFPLEGLGGFQHHRLKEIESHVFVIVYLFYQEHLALSLKELFKRVEAYIHTDKPSSKKGIGQFF